MVRASLGLHVGKSSSTYAWSGGFSPGSPGFHHLWWTIGSIRYCLNKFVAGDILLFFFHRNYVMTNHLLHMKCQDLFSIINTLQCLLLQLRIYVTGHNLHTDIYEVLFFFFFFFLLLGIFKKFYNRIAIIWMSTIIKTYEEKRKNPTYLKG